MSEQNIKASVFNRDAAIIDAVLAEIIKKAGIENKMDWDAVKLQARSNLPASDLDASQERIWIDNVVDRVAACVSERNL